MGGSQYNYNKENYQKRYRRQSEQITFKCRYCNTDIPPSQTICPECGNEYQIEQFMPQNQTKKEDQEKKFVLKLNEFQGIATIPYFVLNFLNFVYKDFEEQPQGVSIELSWPFKFPCKLMKRGDITTKQSNMKILYSQEQDKTVYIPYMDIKQLRDFLDEERKRKDVPAEASFKPADLIYLSTIHRLLYNDNIPIISKEDLEKMKQLFKQYNTKLEQILQTKQQNHPMLEQVIYYIINTYFKEKYYLLNQFYKKSTNINKLIPECFKE